MGNEAKVLKAFAEAGQPVGAKDIALATGLDKKEVDKAIKVLKEEGKIHSPKRCVYEPK
ncbi:MAG: helix-turn-helix domain-containing protein [Syntrophomonadaceae bacterium]|nr:helix-turn-helix domain-containing protein [Syntrophomonadaceae bacterium]